MEGLTESVRKYLFHIQAEVKENGRSHRVCKKVPVLVSRKLVQVLLRDNQQKLVLDYEEILSI